ncbi:alpha/beta fold hydrolase [Hyphomonas sp. WL0036]|uniref:alpha/beta fold hydrolase n=1 Tax=Hyphomonas sediminis TaxID=2866160 RepID=UPI001C7F0C7F|nr:alpha/beta hydrolase [Hyphomonas sediminis]MBY9066133.1 alpha/beta fold hydrolase [Hyphomonas sediminis]
MSQITANGIELEYETAGNPGDPAILLIMGFAFQMTRWPPEFRQALADAGYYVIWFDNRDIGLSQEMVELGVPDIAGVMDALEAGHDASPFAPYTLNDLAADAAGLLDALDIDQAAVLGMSMGGAIAQIMAINHPHKVRQLITMMATSGAPGLPAATPEAMEAIISVPAQRTAEAIGEIAIVTQHAIGSAPALRNSADTIRQRAIDDFNRSDRALGTLRQFAAIRAQPRWHEHLSELSLPALILHGEADPLVRLGCGEDIAQRIPGARFRSFPGWGHDLADAMSETLAAEVIAFLKE